MSTAQSLQGAAADKPAVSSYTPAPHARFKVGDVVRIRHSTAPGHRRTPGYIRGKIGEVERICGEMANPEELAYGFDGKPDRVLYRVRFKQREVWPNYDGPEHDIIEMEIYEHWMAPVEDGQP